MISTEKLEKMTNLKKYRKYCKKKYKPFFDYLKQEKIKYYFENKKINICCERRITLNNIELPPITEFNFRNFACKDASTVIALIHYPCKTLPKFISIPKKINWNNHDHSFSKYGDLSIYYSPKLQEIPDNFTLYGSLNAYRSSIKKIGNNCVIDGDFFLNNSNVEKMGENIKVRERFSIVGCSLKKLPNKIEALGGLNASYSDLEEIPDDISISYILDISNTKVKRLPSGLKLEIIKANNSDLEEIPDDISISWLDISNTKVRRLPFSLNSKISKDTKIIINNIIENINEFNLYNFYIENSIWLFKIKDSFINKKDNTFDIMNFITKGYNEEKYSDIVFKNILLYYSDLLIHRKLLLEQFDKISEQEIKEFINNKDKKYRIKLFFKNFYKKITKHILNRFSIENTSINDKDKNKEKWKVKELLSIKEEKIPIIYYCQSKKAFEFLYKNNYKFTQEEYDKISSKDLIKGLYEMYLLKYTTKYKKNLAELTNLKIPNISNTANINKKSSNKYNVLLNNRNKL